VAVIAGHCINYSPFLTSISVIPLIVLPSMYLSLQAQVKIRYDPYTREPAVNDSSYTSTQMSQIFIILFFTLIHHYLCQRDLLILTIEKRMI
jgi:hypothetical protein